MEKLNQLKSSVENIRNQIESTLKEKNLLERARKVAELRLKKFRGDLEKSFGVEARRVQKLVESSKKELDRLKMLLPSISQKQEDLKKSIEQHIRELETAVHRFIKRGPSVKKKVSRPKSKRTNSKA